MAAIKERNSAFMVAIILGFSNILLIGYLCTKQQKVVIVPAYQKQSFWVSNNQVSREYLEEMSIFLIELLLNLTSESINYQRDVVLKHVDPTFYSLLKKQFLIDEERYKKESLATSIKPIHIVVNSQENSTQVTGIFTSLISGRVVKQTKDLYEFKFSYSKGELLIKEFNLLSSEDYV
jgi:conjugal transfer pilus assembly protein TraE